MGHGERCLTELPTNMDDFRTTERYSNKIQSIKMQKIDIACIQEKHNIETTTYEEDGYKIISTPSKAREMIDIENYG